MGIKKNEARFTIKFDPNNPRQREVMRILNDAGRRKAALITDALLCMFGYYGGNTDAAMLHNKPSSISRPGHPQRQHVARASECEPSRHDAATPLVTQTETDEAADTAQSSGDDAWQTINDSLGEFF